MSWFFTVNSISAPLWIALILVAVLLGLNLLVDFGVLVGLNLRKPKAAASAPKSMLPGELTKVSGCVQSLLFFTITLRNITTSSF